MKVYEFTVPELEYFRTYCNFTRDERTLFDYRSKNIDALYDEYIAAKMAYQEHGDAAHKDKLMDSVGRLMVEVFDMLQAMILDADFRDERQAIMQQIRKLAD